MDKLLLLISCLVLAATFAPHAIAATYPNPLGITQVDLIAVAPANGSGNNVSTSFESNLANVYCNALLANTTGNTLTVCILNGGAFRANIPTGKITTKTLQEVYPFKDTVVSLQITGDTLLSLLQTGVSAYPTGGSFPQVGRLRYSFLPVPSFNSNTGYASRLINAQLINDTTIYGVGGDSSVTLVTNSYVAAGNDGYDVLKSAKVLSNSTETVNAFVANYIVEQKVVGFPPDGRIVDCTGKLNDPFCIAQNNGNNGGNGGGSATSSATAAAQFVFYFIAAFAFMF